MSSLGEVISTARRAIGLTQEELAARMDVSQAALSRYEKDMRTPEPDVLPRLASALGVTERFLEKASMPTAAMAVDAHMRRRATAKATVWRQLEAKLNMARMHSEQLREIVALSATFTVPSFDPFDVTPQDAARFVRMQWRMPTGPVQSMTRWLEASGAVILSEDLGGTRVDGLSQWTTDHPVLLINAAAPPDRQRLTMAHELGHLVLHRLDVPPEVEEQATAFAAEFLMPEVLIKNELRNLTLGKALVLKQEWGVSMQAIIERANDLRMISKEKRSSLYRQLSARGMRIKEPGSEEIPPEQPQLLSSVRQYLQGQGLGEDEVAHIAGYSTPADNWLLPPSQGLRAVR